MKTIFLTIFEGVEAKNILRTSVLPTLLSDSSVRIVMLVKNEERKAYHQQEFHNPRIDYAVVAPIDIRGFDAFFRWLRYELLRTATTNVRRRMSLEVSHNYFSYIFGHFVNWVLARPVVVRLARFFDELLVRNSTYDALFAQYHPDLVLLANLFDEQEVHLLRAAKAHCVRTVGFMNSWDKPSARSIMRLLPDVAIVFNDVVRDDLMRYHLVPSEHIFVSGIPQYDRYFTGPVSSRSDFLRMLGFSEDTKLIIYSPVGAGPAGGADWDVIDLLHNLIVLGKFSGEVSLLVRFPPNDFIDDTELARRPWLRYDYPGIRFSKKRGLDWDMTVSELGHLNDTLHHMNLLICFSSSISVDAATLDKPVININFDVRPPVGRWSATRYYSFEHYKKALDTGGICKVESVDELVRSVNRYLQDPTIDHDGRMRLVAEQCKFTDGKSGEGIGRFILGQL